MDLGAPTKDRGAQARSLLVYNNEARLWIELGRRMSPDEMSELPLITSRLAAPEYGTIRHRCWRGYCGRQV